MHAGVRCRLRPHLMPQTRNGGTIFRMRRRRRGGRHRRCTGRAWPSSPRRGESRCARPGFRRSSRPCACRPAAGRGLRDASPTRCTRLRPRRHPRRGSGRASADPAKRGTRYAAGDLVQHVVAHAVEPVGVGEFTREALSRAPVRDTPGAEASADLLRGVEGCRVDPARAAAATGARLGGRADGSACHGVRVIPEEGQLTTHRRLAICTSEAMPTDPMQAVCPQGSTGSSGVIEVLPAARAPDPSRSGALGIYVLQPPLATDDQDASAPARRGGVDVHGAADL